MTPTMQSLTPFALFILSLAIGVIGFFLRQLIDEVKLARTSNEVQARNMAIVLERTKSISDDLEKIKNRFLQIERDQAGILANLSSQNERSTTQESRIARTEERIGHIEQRVSRLEASP